MSRFKIFRHGDRVPEYPYPKDPFSDPSTWPEGWGQLTKVCHRELWLKSFLELIIS